MPPTSEMCIIRNPSTLKANAMFSTNPRKVATREPGIAASSTSPKNAINDGNSETVTSEVSSNVYRRKSKKNL